MPVTEILFGDQDGQRTGPTAAGPVASIQVAPPGDGVTEITTVETPPAGAYTLTSEEAPGGFEWGYNSLSPYGALTPSTFNGENIIAIFSNDFLGTYVVIDGVHAQDFFDTIEFNGLTLNTATANFTTTTSSQWEWLGDFMFNAAGDFDGDIS